MLAPVLIFYAGWGVKGAALSTIISQVRAAQSSPKSAAQSVSLVSWCYFQHSTAGLRDDAQYVQYVQMMISGLGFRVMNKVLVVDNNMKGTTLY
jgi:hypothetical protein